MAKYKKRADGRYEAKVQIGVDPITGRYVRKTLYAKTIAELELKKAKAIADIERGIYVDDKKITLYEYATKWNLVTNENKSESTKNGYNNIIKNHMTSIGGLKLSDITKTDILMELNNLDGHHDLQRRLKMTLEQVLESAIDDGLIYKNVCRNIKLGADTEKKGKEPLTDFELDCIKKADLNVRERCFISLLLWTGMRKSEIFALNVHDINLRKKIITVNHGLEYIKEQPHLKAPKSLKGYRTIPILSELRPVLQKYISTLEYNDLFTKQDGTLLTKSGARSFWDTIYRKLSDAAGATHKTGPNKKIIYLTDPLHGLTCHRFRHNFATIMYYAGIDAKEAARILGHSSVKITLEIYTHLDEEKSKSHLLLEKFIQGN